MRGCDSGAAGWLAVDLACIWFEGRAIRRSRRRRAKDIAVFQVKSVIPAHAPTFADWKSHVADDYRNEQVPALMSQKTAELAAKAKAENDLAKAAKEVGATVKTSDLVDQTGQVPDFGAVGQVAPQLFEMTPGTISGPINAGRTGVVAKLVDKQQPSDAEIAKNLDQTRDQLLDQKRQEAFGVFANTIIANTRRTIGSASMRSRRHRYRASRHGVISWGGNKARFRYLEAGLCV